MQHCQGIRKYDYEEFSMSIIFRRLICIDLILIMILFFNGCGKPKPLTFKQAQKQAEQYLLDTCIDEGVNIAHFTKPKLIRTELSGVGVKFWYFEIHDIRKPRKAGPIFITIYEDGYQKLEFSSNEEYPFR
jgi:hypothetical protein